MLELRAVPEQNRVLLRLTPGCGYPVHSHSVAEEVFVLESVYVDPDQGHRARSPVIPLLPTRHNATTPSGCTFLVITIKPTPVR